MTIPRPFIQKCLCIVVLLTFALLPAVAQTSAAGTINGTVTDSSGAAIANAAVVVKDTDTGVVHNATTNSEGSFILPFLQSGHYEVIASAPNFSKVDHKNLQLTVGQTMTVNSELPAASVATDVVVLSQPSILDPQKTEVSQTVGEELINNLPVNARNWNDFVLLTPNVVQDGGNGLISFHGISSLYNQNYVDGANNNEMLFSEARGRASGAPYVYSVDSIKEFQAQTSNYSVEFGQAAGGQVNAITKNGTNNIHGDIFYYLRYPTLNALDPYSKFQALHAGATPFLLTQPTHQQQQFGGSIGGPIIKDHLFYFFTYDGFRKIGRVLYSTTNTITTTPTPSNAGGTVISPTQCPVNTASTPTISAAQCLSAINFLLSVGNLSAGSTPPTRFQKSNIFFPRLDWHLNSKNDMFVNYNFADFDQGLGYSNGTTFSNSSPTANGSTSYHERFLIAGFTTQISASMVNEIHFQYGRDLETASANASGPSIATGVITFGMPNGLPRAGEPDEHRTQFTDVFSLTHGHHSFKFGGDANLVHEVMINLFQGGGVYGYSGSTPALNFANWAQDAFQGQAGDTDPGAGYHYSTFVQTIDTKNPAPSLQAGSDDFWMKMFDGFAEDSWKVRPNVTINAGVRYDIQLTPPPTTNNPNFAPVSIKYSSTIKNVTDRVQPRIGVSWEPYKGTVVRGGYGLFSALNQGSTYYAMRVENGIVQVNYNFTGCTETTGAAGPGVGTTCTTVPTSLKYPNVPFPVTGPSLSTALYPTGGAAPTVNGPTTLGAQSFHGLDPNFVPPLAHEFDASVEEALPYHMSLSVGYVGTRALHLPVFVDSNLVGQTPHGLKSYNVLDANNNIVKQLTVPVYLQSDRIVPSLQAFNTGFSAANTWYNSMAVTLRRPFTNGLEFLLNYTWAHATDTSQVAGNFGTFFGGDTPLDPNNISLENGPSDNDVRNRFAGSVVYQPHVYESNPYVKHILDDFIFSGTMIASGGQPISLAMTGTVYNGTGTSYGSGGNIYGGAISSSSGAATTGRPPQVGRNSISGPGFNDIDFRISRNVPIYRNMHLQFSMDAFNLLNHKIVLGEVGTFSLYGAASSSSLTCNTGASVPTGSSLQGCITPNPATGLSQFGAPNSTSNNLYGPRQLQFSAKLFF